MNKDDPIVVSDDDDEVVITKTTKAKPIVVMSDSDEEEAFFLECHTDPTIRPLANTPRPATNPAGSRFTGGRTVSIGAVARQNKATTSQGPSKPSNSANKDNEKDNDKGKLRPYVSRVLGYEVRK